MAQEAPELSVVVLCYRTGRRLYSFIPKVIDVISHGQFSWEMMLVGNYVSGEEDETPSVVRDIASKDSRIRAITLEKLGKMGWDARTGLREAGGNYICLIDGDEQMPPSDILRVYNKIKDEGLDLVMPYREKRHDGFMRTANSRAYNLVARSLFPGIRARDINAKPKIISRSSYEKMRLVSDDWFLDAEIVIQARDLGLKTGEIPTEFYRCEFRRSFVKIEAVIEFLKNLLRLRVKKIIGGRWTGR